MKQCLLIASLLSIATAVQADSVSLRITVELSADQDAIEELLQEAKADGSLLTQKYKAHNKVTHVAKRVNKEQRCAACNGGQPKDDNKCSSCNKPCNTCSSCCKMYGEEDMMNADDDDDDNDDDMRCAACGGQPKDDTKCSSCNKPCNSCNTCCKSASENDTKCAACGGQPKDDTKCSSCNKPCNTCSSCCKSSGEEIKCSSCNKPCNTCSSCCKMYGEEDMMNTDDDDDDNDDDMRCGACGGNKEKPEQQ